MNKETTEDKKHSNYNCAQSVLLSLREHFPHVYDKILTQAAAGFGAGVCSGEICGAASAAVMAIGLSVDYDTSDPDSFNNVRKLVRSKSRTFTGDFKNKFGSLRCCELKEAGCDCGELIEYAENRADEIIKNLN